jgi:hypothetical protein
VISQPPALNFCPQNSASRRQGDDLAFLAGAAKELGYAVAHLGEGFATETPSLVEFIGGAG